MSFTRRQVRPANLPTVIRYKWMEQTLEEGVVPLSKMALRTFSRVFTGSHAVEQLQVILSVIDYRNPKNPWPPTWEFLAFIAGLDVSTVKSRVQELETVGYVQREERKERVELHFHGFLEAVKKAALETPENQEAEAEESAYDESTDLPF